MLSYMMCVYVCCMYVCNRVSKMRDGDKRPQGAVLLITNSRRGVEEIGMRFRIFFYIFSCFVFFFLLTRRLCQPSACVAMISLAPLLVQP